MESHFRGFSLPKNTPNFILHKSRKELSLTREQLAEQCELSVYFFAEIEPGRKNMTTKSLFRSADYILFGEETKAEKTKLEKMLCGYIVSSIFEEPWALI